jgi:hypothetical protein
MTRVMPFDPTRRVQQEVEATSEESVMAPYFCDGLKDVTILNGAARLEFHRLVPAGNGELRAASELLVALPTQGLIQMLSVLEQVRERLIQERLLVPSAPASANHQPEDAPQTSPNFA